MTVWEMKINSRRVRAQPALTLSANVKEGWGIPPEIFSAVSPTEYERWVYSEVVSIPWRKTKPLLMKFFFSHPFPTPTTFPLNVLSGDPILPISPRSIQPMGTMLIYQAQQEMLVEDSSKCPADDPETSGIKT